MDRCAGPMTALIIALYGGLQLAIIMDRYAGPKTALTIVLHGGL
jgi:ABC-type phosphate transport system permease subunit